MADNLMTKLSRIQIELKAPKNQYNKFGKYKYRSCEDILEAVKPICNKNRTTLIVTDEIVQYSERYYIKATATLFDWDSEISIQTSALARESQTKKGMDDSQITGTASSYARKYALNGLFNIDDTKDNDTEEAKNEQDNRAKKGSNDTRNDRDTVPTKTSKDVKAEAIWKYYTDNKDTFGTVLKAFLNGRKLTEMTEDELDGLLELIETSKHTMED